MWNSVRLKPAFAKIDKKQTVNDLWGISTLQTGLNTPVMSLHKAVKAAGSDLREFNSKHLANKISWQNCWKPVPPKKGGQLGRNTVPWASADWETLFLTKWWRVKDGSSEWNGVHCTLYTVHCTLYWQIPQDQLKVSQGIILAWVTLKKSTHVATFHKESRKWELSFVFFGQRRHQRTRMGFFKVIYPWEINNFLL